MSDAHAAETRLYRVRNCRPLLDGDGSCTLIYDLERTFVIAVPEQFWSRIASAGATAELDEPLRTWMKDEGLLTTEPRQGWSDSALEVPPQVTDVSFDMSGSCNMGCVYCFEDAIDSRIGRMSDETALAALDFVFKKSAGARHVTIHFGSGEPLLRFDLLCKIVEEANRRAASEGRTVAYDLTTNATLISRDVAALLRDQPFNVRVSCDGPAEVHDLFRPMKTGKPSYALVEKGLEVLLEHIPDRLTVNTVICGRTRLKDVWRWAKQMGIHHYHVIKVGAYNSRNIGLQQSERENFCADLEGICQDMFGNLQAGLRPLDYQPITKIVRRLMIPQPITRFCGVAGSYLGIASNGKIYPCFRHLGLKDHRLGDVHTGVDDGKRVAYLKQEAADVDSRPICSSCWARYLCGGGCYADSVVYGPDKRKPQEDHCPFWRIEIETAIRFYHQLRQADPSYCFRLFGDDIDRVLADSSGDPLEFLCRMNCS